MLRSKKTVDEYNDLQSTLRPLSDDTQVDIDSIEQSIRLLKLSKAAGHDGLTAEHIVHSHPSIVVHIKLLFTMILSHSFVPDAFGVGIVIPVVKNKHGDLSSVDNYRPITLSPVISKIFETFLLSKYSSYMSTDDLQFGFKKDLGCNHAIFALRQVINYFNERGSNVYLASLDAQKAFDRLNHFKLYSTLIRNGLPTCFVKLIINWYSKLSIVVRWNGCLSTPLTVLSGVRQGGILSSGLFNLYINTIFSTLRKRRLGCHLYNMFLSCIGYADDLVLLSASVIELQVMLDICGEIGDELGLKYNANKSLCMVVGPNKLAIPEPMNINNAVVQWSDCMKYLGITVVSAKVFKVDFKQTRRKFFTAVNTILNKCTFTSDIVKLKLLESHCMPILLYAVESTNLNADQKRELNSWWNSVYRKVFGYHKWESVKSVICYMERLDLLHTINLRQLLFLKKISFIDNSVMSNIMRYYVHGRELKITQDLFGTSISDSIESIKQRLYESFKQLCSSE